MSKQEFFQQKTKTDLKTWSLIGSCIPLSVLFIAAGEPLAAVVACLAALARLGWELKN